jgi:hypothetical protein
MSIKSVLIALALPAACVVCPSMARAESPGLSTYVWNLPSLSFSDCMQRASNALRQIGVKDVQETTPSTGLGFVGGEFDNYFLSVICISFKGIVVTQATGTYYNTAEKYRERIDLSMGNGSGR